MSKRDNKRFQDSERSTPPKRGGKNRRDYGDNYEPRRRSDSERSKSYSSDSRQGRSSARKTRDASKPRRDIQGRSSARKTFSYDKDAMSRRRNDDFGYGDMQPIVGTDGLGIVAGRNPVIEALNGEREVERIFIADGSEGSISKVIAIAREQGVIIDFVPKEKIDAMAPGAKHQGVVAKVSEYKYAELDEVFVKAEESGEDPFIIILDEVTDPHNLGAIIRTAECVGAHGVIIPKRRAASLTQTVALSAAGALEKMPVVQVTNLTRTIEELKNKGLWIGAADMDGEIYYNANLNGPIAIVVGNEGRGVGRLIKEKCDFVLSIPMYGSINSLNASNAAAVLMYGIRRARSEA